MALEFALQYKEELRKRVTWCSRVTPHKGHRLEPKHPERKSDERIKLPCELRFFRRSSIGTLQRTLLLSAEGVKR